MQTTPYVDALLADLEAMASLGDEAVADAARRLSQTLRASAGMRLLDLLGEAALEVSSQLPSGHVEVRLAGQEPSLVYVDEEPEPAAQAAQGADDSSARITLRLSEALKSSVEAAAAREGVSVNTWIVRALGRASSAPTTVRRSGRRLTGYAES
jgi:sugar (pentulose or hexulose) kinase